MNKSEVLKAVDDAFENVLDYYECDLPCFRAEYGDTPLGQTPISDSVVDILLTVEDELEVELPVDDEDTVLLYSYNELREKVCEWVQ